MIVIPESWISTDPRNKITVVLKPEFIKCFALYGAKSRAKMTDFEDEQTNKIWVVSVVNLKNLI